MPYGEAEWYTHRQGIPTRNQAVTEYTSKLKQAGLKVTLPRLKILEILSQGEGQHASAEDIYKILLTHDEDIGVATIYRVLTQCEQAGLVKRHQFEGGRAVFEIAEGDHHDHIICVRCGVVKEFNDETIEARQRQIAEKAGFKMAEHNMTLYGLCKKCQQLPMEK
ncbi:MAG: ferric iron uptake transcriptional regulator [Sedimenticola selenatireducens]|uniref:Ferric uptake regulation protein n=1 Tax=Sedimenticola selenatireducens TaxID=191960 RepID=A0A2N6CSK3_9GAMM|nr:MAG: ferric iron uptake transcriptional regulator [Sedimenticola selenatireducens]